jgi:hypothetical protein
MEGGKRTVGYSLRRKEGLDLDFGIYLLIRDIRTEELRHHMNKNTIVKGYVPGQAIVCANQLTPQSFCREIPNPSRLYLSTILRAKITRRSKTVAVF